MEPPRRIGELAVSWIVHSPRARVELRMVEPELNVTAALFLLDSSYERLLELRPEVANLVADLVDAFHDRLDTMEAAR